MFKRVALNVLFGAALSSAQAAPMTAPIKVAGFSHVKSLGSVAEYRLDSNGLTVLLVEDHSAPVVTFNVTYLVGSRNEVTGTTGATHLLEHLMFKGTDKHNDAAGTSLTHYMERVGARINATTWLDRTHYFGTLGRDHLERYVAMEADRMRNLWLRDSDRQAEMTVVRNEFERNMNDPSGVLGKEVFATAYQALPYHHPTIGWRSDIEGVPIEKLRAFYETYYWPNNATVTLVGDFESAAALRLIKQNYGVYPSSPQAIPQMYTEEPQQTGPRRVTVKAPGELGTVMIAHKIPDGRHADQAPLAVLDAILSSGKSSRLYQALVDKGLALDASASSNTYRDLSLHMLDARLAPGATHEQVERALLEEVQKIGKEGVSVAEVELVKQQTRAQSAYRRDGTSGVMAELNEWIATGDWTLYVTFPEKMAQVTPADVQRVARQYLHEDQSTTGWFVPVKAEQPVRVSASAPVARQ